MTGHLRWNMQENLAWMHGCQTVSQPYAPNETANSQSLKRNCSFHKKKEKCCQSRKWEETVAKPESECIKKILVHLFKVDAKHSHRRVVHPRVWMFGIGGNRPNGFILTQWPRMQAHLLPAALSTGQITPQSAIHCRLSICMLSSSRVTWLRQSATSYGILFPRASQSFQALKRTDVALIVSQIGKYFSPWFLCLFCS